MRQEAKLTSEQIAEAPSPDFLLLLDKESETPGSHENSYKAVRSWIESSLDIYKVQLSQILYPLFVHIYLSLIEGGHIEQARSFMDQFKADHIDIHRADILKLSAVSNAQQMKENDYLNTIRQEKSTISMSSYTFELLLSFLQEKKYVFLLKILNQYILIKGRANTAFNRLTVENSFRQRGRRRHRSRLCR